MNNIVEKLNEYLRLCNLYKEECKKFHNNLCIDNINPNTTMAIYFGSLQLEYYIKRFLDIRNSFKSFDIFLDPFESKEFLPVNDLWLFCSVVKGNKDSIQQLVDLDFMNSKKRTLRLFDMKSENYKELLILWEKNIDDIIYRLENIKETWYEKNIHYELKKEIYYVDKEEMALYKLIEIPKDEQHNFIFLKNTISDEGVSRVDHININPDNIRSSLNHELFLEMKLSQIYPEYFL